MQRGSGLWAEQETPQRGVCPVFLGVQPLGSAVLDSGKQRSILINPQRAP